jgi:hypothetical protein
MEDQMRKLALLTTTLCVLASTGAYAQGWDGDRDRGYGERTYRERNWRDEDRGERAAREIFRGVTGQGRECRVITRRERDRDGDVVITRRRVCD